MVGRRVEFWLRKVKISLRASLSRTPRSVLGESLRLARALAVASLLLCLNTAAADASGPSAPPPFGNMIMVRPKPLTFTIAPGIPQLKMELPRSTGAGAASPAAVVTGERPVKPMAPRSLPAGAQAVGCAAGSGQPGPIVALAAALKCDPDLIFEWVFDNIEYEPLFGSNKGALGTLLDRRGNDADQAILLVALFNAAGYPASQTGFVQGLFSISGSQLSNLLKVKNDATAIENLLNSGVIPSLNPVVAADGSLTSIELTWFVAAIQLNGTWYYFTD